MPKQRKPFELTIKYVETPDAQERLDKAYAIILKADDTGGRREKR